MEVWAGQLILKEQGSRGQKAGHHLGEGAAVDPWSPRELEDRDRHCFKTHKLNENPCVSQKVVIFT